MRPQSHRQRRSRHFGVTLIELVIVIVLTGILVAVIAQFVWPVFAYTDVNQRAALADTADTALRRMGRDLRLALPNSVRVTTITPGAESYMELLLVRVGGRYRSDSVGGSGACGAAGDALTFGAADTCFTTLGDVPNIGQVTTSDRVVVFNLQPGTANADAYQAGNNRQITPVPVSGSGSDMITFASNTFTYESPGKRFYIIQGPVTYGCNTATGNLTRYSGYSIQSSQPTTPSALPLSGGTSAILASGVTNCSFTYNANASTQGAGLATMALQLTAQTSRGGTETVALYHAVHVNNVP